MYTKWFLDTLCAKAWSRVTNIKPQQCMLDHTIIRTCLLQIIILSKLYDYNYYEVVNTVFLLKILHLVAEMCSKISASFLVPFQQPNMKSPVLQRRRTNTRSLSHLQLFGTSGSYVTIFGQADLKLFILHRIRRNA